MASKSALQDIQESSAAQAKQAAKTMGTYAGGAAPGYQAFAATGGVSPQEEQLTRQEVASGIGAQTSAARQQLEQQRRIQGGYSPGYGASQRALTRDLGAMTGQQIGAGELGLLQQRRQGQLAGMGGLTNLAGLYGYQIPQMYGISERAAEATPSALDYIGAIGDLAGQFGAPTFTGLRGVFRKKQQQQSSDAGLVG